MAIVGEAAYLGFSFLDIYIPSSRSFLQIEGHCIGRNTIESGSEPGAGASPFYRFDRSK